MKFAPPVLAFALVASAAVQAQDYLLPVHGDTLYGKVQPLTFGSFDQVQIILDGKKRVYNVIQVRAFCYENILYHPVRLNNKYWFMRLISPGYLSIYAHRPEGSHQYDGRLLLKMDGRSLEVPNIGFRNTVADFLADCPVVSDRVRNSELNKKELELIVHEYNICKERPAVPEPLLIASDDPALRALDELTDTAKGIDMDEKEDALQLITDIRNRLVRSEKISRYQLDALKSFFQSNEATQRELEKFLELVR